MHCIFHAEHGLSQNKYQFTNLERIAGLAWSEYDGDRNHLRICQASHYTTTRRFILVMISNFYSTLFSLIDYREIMHI
jgi:hypothetical protein